MVIVVGIILVITGSLIAETINVPGDYETIQEAIDAANDYDTIRVDSGIYYENLVISKILLIIKVNFVEEPIIDGGQNGPVISYVNCEGGGCLVGFVIVNGKSENGNGNVDGGGIHCENSEINLHSLIVENNYGINGAGIGISNSTVNISSSEIEYNFGIENFGGGGIVVAGAGSVVNIHNVNIHHNLSEYGGGIYCHDGANIEIDTSLIQNNSAVYEGGGIRLYGCGDITIIRTEITNNISNGNAGGIWSADNNDLFFITHSQIFNNEAMHNGGGIWMDNSSFDLNHVEIRDNTALGNEVGSGGGIYLSNNSYVDINMSELSGNTSLLSGGGIAIVDNSNAEISDTSISNNTVEGTLNNDALGGGIAVSNAELTIYIVEVTDNHAFNGGGIYGENAADICIEKSLISGNIGMYGGSVYTFTETSPTEVKIINSTITHDPSTYSIFLHDTNFVMLNSIMWSNISFPVRMVALNHESFGIIDCSDIFNGENGVSITSVNEECEFVWGEHNLAQDPLFINSDPQNSDYHLFENSPCIDAGTNYFEWEGEILYETYHNYNGSAPDMGCYETLYYLDSPVISIIMDNSNVNLNWDPVFGAANYNIYRSADPNNFGEAYDNTSEVFWIDNEVSDKMFYYVTAKN